MARKYEQRLRAEKQDETRRRIVEAAVELHGTLGPGTTSLSAVAERAGVQRNTLYRHFPDERSLLFACSGHYNAQHPLPSTEDWADIADPVDRARHGLRTLYAYYEETEAMMSRVLRDADINPHVAEQLDLWRQGLDGAREELLRAWPRNARTKKLTAMVGLAFSFRTWQSLVRDSGLTSRAAADLMASTLECTTR